MVMRSVRHILDVMINAVSTVITPELHLAGFRPLHEIGNAGSLNSSRTF